jgi:hypothetical protein
MKGAWLRIEHFEPGEEMVSTFRRVWVVVSDGSVYIANSQAIGAETVAVDLSKLLAAIARAS